MKATLRRGIAVLAIALTGGASLVVARIGAASRAPATRLTAGTPLPALQLQRADGSRWSTSDARGARLVLIYASAQCGHCHEELARWARLATEHPELVRGTTIAVVTRDLVPATAADLVPATLPHLRLVDIDGSGARALRLYAVPVTLFVDPTGVITTITLGESAPDSLRARLQRHRTPAPRGVDHAS